MRYRDDLAKKKVSKVRHLIIQNPSVIGPDAEMRELMYKINEDLRTRHVYVVDKDNRLIGSIRMNSVVQYLFPYCDVLTPGIIMNTEYSRNIFESKVSEFMRKHPLFVKENNTLEECANIFIEEKINELPVVADDMTLIGQISMHEIIRDYKNYFGEQEKSQ